MGSFDGGDPRPEGTRHIRKAPSLRGGRFRGPEAEDLGPFIAKEIELPEAFLRNVRDARRLLKAGSDREQVREKYGMFVLRKALSDEADDAARS